MEKRKYSCSAKTQRSIFNAAMQLFLKQGFHDTTLAEIAEFADVSTGTLYRYFPSKGDFLLEVVSNSLEQLSVFIEDLSDDDMSVEDALVAAMMKDIQNTAEQFEKIELPNNLAKAGESAEESRGLPSSVALAYNRATYANPVSFEREKEMRARAANVYRAILERAKKAGQLEEGVDIPLLANLIVALYLSEFDNGIFQSNYPYEAKFKAGISFLLEGRTRAVEKEE